MKINERITIIRNRHGYTQEKVAVALGIQRSSYALIESGERKLSFEEAIKLSTFYGQSLDILFSQEAYEAKKENNWKSDEIIKNTIDILYVIKELQHDDYKRLATIQIKEMLSKL